MRLWHAFLAAYLRWLIRADEAWLHACQRDGLADSLDLTGFRRHLGLLRVRLALAEGKARGFRKF